MATQKRIKAVIQFRRAEAANWLKVNPILQEGEPGFEIDTGYLKIGDGEHPWSELEYISGAEAIDYEIVFNKPRIEGIELIGDRSMRELGVDTLSVQEIEKILYLED